MRNDIALACIVVAALSVSACGCLKSGSQADDRRFFLLETTRPGRIDPPGKGPILAVRRMQMSPGFGEKELVYRTSDFAYESDYYNQFLNTAGALIAEQTRRWLARAGLFAAVVSSDSDVLPTHVIEGNVTALYGDFRGDNAKGVLGLELFLIDTDGDHGPTVVFHKEYSAGVDLSDKTAEALVEAYNTGLGQILTEFEKDLRKRSTATTTAP